jgi:transcriptional regulator with XRE-family HTH domain
VTARHTDHNAPADETASPASEGEVTSASVADVAPSSATHLARLIKRRRERVRMSRLRASQLSGINVSSIEAWEMGRVAKPPIHDVMRLAYVLSISPRELQQASFADVPLPEGVDTTARCGWLLLDRAMLVMEWNDHDVGAALSTTPERVRALRDGSARPSELEAVTLGMILGAFPDGASRDDVFALLAQMRG